MTSAPSGGFVLRTPVLPFAVVDRLAHASDVAAEVRDLVSDPVVREAIFLASPSLDDRIEAWLAGRDREADATLRALLSYVSRMSFRPTPFGLFAGCTVGELGAATALRLDEVGRGQRHTRLDFGFLVRLVTAVVADLESRAAVRFQPNSSLYRAGNRLRMVETKIDEHRRVHYHRVTFEEDEALELTLRAAATPAGATPAALAQQLADALAGEDVSVDEAAEFVAAMIESQLLVPTIEPPITGPEPSAGLVTALLGNPVTVKQGRAIEEVTSALAALDAAGPGAEPGTYRDLVTRLRDVDDDLDPARLFQADLVSPAVTLTLGPKVVAELGRAVDVLHRISGRPGDDDLATFRARFTARYEDRQVPLAEALDEELGVGFGAATGLVEEGSPLLAGMPPVASARQDATGPVWTALDTVRLRLLERTLLEGSSELALSSSDVADLESAAGPPRPLPAAYSVTATIAAASAEAVDAGDFEVIVPSVAGPSGARMLGRFCHADPSMEALVRRHLALEEAHDGAADDVAWAEIVHLPEGRAGNVLSRPVLRSFEIPFLGRSGAPPDAQLPVDDLLVSVQGENVVLRSARLGAEVRPRMTTAHNHQRSALAIYRFLATLNFQGVAAGLQWRWGLLDGVPFLPRVVYGRLVLSRARWVLAGSDIDGLLAALDQPARRAAVAELMARLRIPDWVVIVSADHQLPVRLTSDAGLDLLSHEARQRRGVQLTELLPGADRMVVSRPEGLVNHEVIVPMVQTAVAPPPSTAGRTRPRMPTDDLARTFVPGSAWVTAKLYTGKATADLVLRETVAPLVDSLRADGAIDDWFFLRYADPDWHLRVRCHTTAAPAVAGVIAGVGSAAELLIADGRVSRLVIDTYQREVERYGGPVGVALSEALFTADSDAALAIVTAAAGEEGLQERWQVALAGVDRLLGDLGFAVPDRRPLVRAWAAALEAEHGAAGTEARRAGGRLFRRVRANLGRLLEGDAGDGGPGLIAGLAALAERSARLGPVVTELRSADKSGRLTTGIEALANSYCHMHVNRVLRAAHRLQELVIYDLLDRLYQARLAREAR